ncbi:hypothetical protein [Vulcanococcus limneticus]|uniref:hypothetical protein n=1 Tax=Vulcanococcus limneticus TaxID=2170428 RepID=UPI00398C0999
MSSPRHTQPSQRRSARRDPSSTSRNGSSAPSSASRPSRASRPGGALAAAPGGLIGALAAGLDSRRPDGELAGAGPSPLSEHPGLRPSSSQQELVCSAIGLTLKLGLSLVAVVSLVRLAGAYQERLDRHGEITAVLEIQKAKLLKARGRFDQLFATGGEQRLIEEQDQWIAPNRLRVVWEQQKQPPIGAAGSPGAASPFPTVEQPPGAPGTRPSHP